MYIVIQKKILHREAQTQRVSPYRVQVETLWVLNPKSLSAKLYPLSFDREAAQEFGRIKAELKRKGRPIPRTDAQIAAVARVRNLTVLTSDRYFSYVDRLTAEDWVS